LFCWGLQILTWSFESAKMSKKYDARLSQNVG
jgi:hypothetical protein